MSEKVKLTITILDAEIKLSLLLIGFLSELGYSLVQEKTHAKLGKLNFVFKKKGKEDKE